MKKQIIFNILLQIIILVIFVAPAYCFSQNNWLNGLCEVYRTSNFETIGLVSKKSDWRNTWTSITGIKFDSKYYYLLYDRCNGQIEILNSDMSHNNYIINANIIFYNIKQIVTLDYNMDGNDDLFIYSNSTGDVYNFSIYNKKLSLNLVKKYGNIRSSWSEIISIDFNNDGYNNELLFFDASRPIPSGSFSMELYSTDNSANLRNIFKSKILNYSNKFISSIKLGSERGIIAYNALTGIVSSYKFTANSLLKIDSLNFGKGIKSMTTGNFSVISNNYSDIFAYDEVKGIGMFYKIKPTLKPDGTMKYAIILQRSFDYFRKTWSIVKSLHTPFSTDNLFLYESLHHADLPIPTYDKSNQLTHPDILIKDGKYYLSFTPFPYSNDDLENPSILESCNGFNFYNISAGQFSNPVVNMPEINYSFPNTSYCNAYNNDPDILFSRNKFYMIYNEAFRRFPDVHNHKKLDQNVRIIRFNENWGIEDNRIIGAFSNDENVIYSPSLIEINNTYYLFYSDNSNIFYLTSNDINNWDWTNPVKINFISDKLSFRAWHIDVIKNMYDNFYYMLISGTYANYATSGKDDDLYIARSNDLVNWELNIEPLISRAEYDANRIYRSTGYFENKNTITLYFSYLKNSGEWALGLHKSLAISNSWLEINTISSPVDAICLEANYKLYQNYPNPFNSSTNIKFSMSEANNVKIQVFNISGSKVATLINEPLNSGIHNVNFDGSMYTSGLYYYTFEVNGKTVSIQKMLMVK